MKYKHSGQRLAGIAVPLAALRTRSSAGVGEYPDLAELGPICEASGIRLVQLLPVNDSGRQSSPYSALSAFALHPIHLALARLEEAEAFKAQIAGLRERFEGAPRFSYEAVLLAKLQLLDEIYAANRAAIAADRALDAWIAANPWIKAYAVYMRLKRRSDWRSWKDWTEHRDPGPGEIAALWEDPALAAEHRQHAWVQYRCEGQFAAAARALAERGVALKGDLPILLNEDSVDAWADRMSFREDLRAGAPPDQFSPLGQNWGFPIYDWEALARSGYAFWLDRLKQADKFYSAYRIDHVLGFYRIWALGEREREGYLGRFVPGASLGREELATLGMDEARIRWLSEPHIRTTALLQATAAGPDPAGEATRAIRLALDRIGNEELFLFKRAIRGERDIEALDLGGLAKGFLLGAWRDRVLLEIGPGRYIGAWSHRGASAWPSLSPAEQAGLERLFGDLAKRDEPIWEALGRRLLGVLKGATDMLPCAEDLGAVPACVPPSLAELGILALRLPRWTRRYGEAGQPFVALSAYPRLSVCAPSVHDSSTLRDWYEHEGDGAAFLSFLEMRPVEAQPWTQALQAKLLERLAGSASELFISQIQDWLDLSAAYAPRESRDERVNVPGTVSDFNWTYRIPCTLETLAADTAWLAALRRVVEARKAT